MVTIMMGLAAVLFGALIVQSVTKPKRLKLDLQAKPTTKDEGK